MTLKVTFDRIENNLAVFLVRPEEHHKILWPVEYLPPGLEEGSIIKICINADAEQTNAANNRVRGLLNKLQEVRESK